MTKRRENRDDENDGANRSPEPAPTPAVIDVREAQDLLEELVARAAGGEEIVITKDGSPRALLVAMLSRPKRVPGGAKGMIWIADDFDDPLPPEIQQYFDDPQIFPPDVDDDSAR
jgi:antitoxin (DNA-binding transcriptional repressor) of toxin-antitoxin stability system